MSAYFNEELIRPLFRIIGSVLLENKHADKCLQQFFLHHKKLKNDDKAFFADLCYDLLRNWRILQESCGKKNEEIFRSPFSFLPAYYYFKKIDLPDALKKIHFDKHSFFLNLEKNLKIRSISESYPDELDQLFEKELGEEKWDLLSGELNKKPKLYLRVNTIKTTAAKLSQLFTEKKIRHEVYPDSNIIIYKSNLSPFSTDEFKNGLFEIQDIASQKVAKFMQVKSGDRIIDCCAGNGGKSLHIASLLQNKGKIISLDIYDHKLDQLKKRAARAGVQNIEAKIITPELIKKLNGSADRVLIDVPCSGSGVFKRNPDAKWHITTRKIEQLHALQKELLNTYSSFCKPRGTLIYANCSILPSEGEGSINWFLKNNQHWSLQEELRIHPEQMDCDGFYMARLKLIS